MKSEVIQKYFRAISSEKGNKKTFCILDHKKNDRSIIFEKGNRNAIKFMKNKFNSPFKKIIYFLILIKILPIFLKKIKLDSSVGQLILEGGQTKIFNFNKKIVISFLKYPNIDWEKSFIKSKEDQKKIAKKGFAPKILKINKNIPFSIEELLEDNIKIKSSEIFKRLLEFYKTQKTKKVSYFSYIKKLEGKKLFTKLPNTIKKELKKTKKLKNKFFYLTNIHGDFRKEQILLKNKEIVFTDWKSKNDLILRDLFNFLRENKNLFENKEFNYLLQMFPKKIVENAKDYLITSQVSLFLSNLISYDSMVKKLIKSNKKTGVKILQFFKE